MTDEERARSSDLAAVIAWGIAEHGEEHGARLIDKALAAERERFKPLVMLAREIEDKPDSQRWYPKLRQLLANDAAIRALGA